MNKKLKVLQLFNSPYFTPRGYDFKEEFSDEDNMYTERDVYEALLANGYEVRRLGLFNDITPLLEEVKEFKPDVVFNLVEVYNDKTHLEKNIGALLELLDIPYTGTSADGLLICNNKALSKKILRFHRLRVARFHTFYRGQKIWRPKTVKLTAIIKPLCEEASRGISQASVVDNDEAFAERIKFIHENMNLDAIAEEYIEGRELYVSVLGNKKLQVLPPRELKFGDMPDDEPRIATYKAKWDDKYRDHWGIKSVAVGKLADGVMEDLIDACKRAYRALNMNSYVRFDIRVTADGKIYFIEPNANPCIAKIDELALAAEKEGITYNNLIRRIVNMALQNYASGNRKLNRRG